MALKLRWRGTPTKHATFNIGMRLPGRRSVTVGELWTSTTANQLPHTGDSRPGLTAQRRTVFAFRTCQPQSKRTSSGRRDPLRYGVARHGLLLLLLMLISARVTLVVLWLFTNLVDRAFDGFVVPLAGVIFLPWTTLMYVLFWSPGGGVNGWEWIFVALGVIADVGSYGRGAMQRRASYA